MKTYRHRFARIAALAFALTACGGGDSPAAPLPPPFPEVAGTYSVTIAFDQFPSSLARGTGTITFGQPSRQSGLLSGASTILISIGGQTSIITDVINVSVTEAGVIHFRIIPQNASSSWIFDGTLVANSGSAMMIGTHLLVGSGGLNAGTWTATRR